MRSAPMSLVLAAAMALLSFPGMATAAGKTEAPAPARPSDGARASEGARAAKVIRTVVAEPMTEDVTETLPDAATETSPEDVTEPAVEESPKPAAGPASVKWLSPRANGVLFRPGTVELEWKSTFPADTFYTVTLSRTGKTFQEVVAPWQSGSTAKWTLPAQNRADYFLRVKAMDASGKMLDDDIIPVHVLPENAIVISKENQTLWAFEKGRLRHRFTVSTGAKSTETRSGWFEVYNRVPLHHSSLYDAPMPFSLFFDGGMAIHASGYIKELGTPTSHGCVRIRLFEARSLYADSQVGRPVIVTEWGDDMSYLDATMEPPTVETRTARRDKTPAPATAAVVPVASR